MWSCDPRRFTGFCDEDYAIAKGMEVYGHEYAMHFPYHAWPAGRDKKHSPIHAKVMELGGQMGAYNGWERANWFAEPGDDVSEESTQTWSRNGPWEPRIKAECEAVRDGVGVLDLPGFSRYRVHGQGAAQWLDGLITGSLPRVGRIGLAYFANKNGRILTEMSVTRAAEDHFYLITAATAQWHDREWLEKHLPAGSPIKIEDITDEFDTLIVTGPKSRDLLAGIFSADLTLPWLSRIETDYKGAWAALMRVSFAGELGWEVHAANADVPAIYNAVLDGGAKPFGMFALNSLRIEKGYRAWKGDLSTDYTVLQGGLDRFVRLDKEVDFIGKAALREESQRAPDRRFVSLIVDTDEYDAPYMSTIWHGNEVVGETTSGAWGYRVNASVALGMLRADLAEANTKVDVEIFGERRPAVVQQHQAVWDPSNERLRA